jgi:hypothetical protein
VREVDNLQLKETTDFLHGRRFDAVRGGAVGFLCRFGGALVLLFSAVGIVGCVAGIVGILAFHQGVTERVQTISARLDVGLQHVSAASENVGRAAAKARADVAVVGKESPGRDGGAERKGRGSRAVRSLIQQQAGPKMEDLGGRLATLSDAAVALSSLLESFQELPPGRSLRFDPDQMKRRADEAQQLSATLRRLERTLGDGDEDGGGRDAAAARSEVDRVLERCEAAAGNCQSDLDGAREGLATVRERIVGWVMWVAIALTVLLVWVGAGQPVCARLAMVQRRSNSARGARPCP